MLPLINIFEHGLFLLLAVIGAASVVQVIAGGLGFSLAWIARVQTPMVQLAVAIVLLFLTLCLIIGVRDFAHILAWNRPA
jgi:hypothetical protein